MATRTDPLPSSGAPAPSAPADSPFTQFRQRPGMYLCAEVEDLVRTLPAKSFLIENLIQPCSINLLVGDSGIGKSALGYQLGLAVAAGAPFLGFPVRQGKVLFVDYENAIRDFHRILEQQRKHPLQGGIEGAQRINDHQLRAHLQNGFLELPVAVAGM